MYLFFRKSYNSNSEWQRGLCNSEGVTCECGQGCKQSNWEGLHPSWWKTDQAGVLPQRWL